MGSVLELLQNSTGTENELPYVKVGPFEYQGSGRQWGEVDSLALCS